MLFYRVAKFVANAYAFNDKLVPGELFTVQELEGKCVNTGTRYWRNDNLVLEPVWINEDDKRSIYKKNGHRFADDKVIYSECAFYTICNTGGIVLFDVNEDYVVAGFSVMDNPISQVRKNKVYWNSVDENGESRPYFVKGGHRIFLDECMRMHI